MPELSLIKQLDFSIIDAPVPSETLPEQFTFLKQSDFVPISAIDDFEYTYWDKNQRSYRSLSMTLPPPVLEIDIDQAIEDYKYYLGGTERSGLTPMSFVDYTFLKVWSIDVIGKLEDYPASEDFYRAHCMRRMHYAKACVQAEVEYGELEP